MSVSRRDDLSRAVSDRFGSTPSPGRGVEVGQMLEGFYNDHGYLRATVRPTQEVFHDPDRTVLVFEIESGPRAKVAHATVAGDPGEPEAAFLRRMHAEPGSVYQRTEVDDRLREFVQRVRKQGRYQAVATHRFREVERRHHRRPRVRPGARAARVDRLRRGSDAADKLQELVPVRTECSVEEDLIEDSERRITESLRQQGYWKASARSPRNGPPTDGWSSSSPFIADCSTGSTREAPRSPAMRRFPIEELQPSLVRLQEGMLYHSANLDAATGAIRALYLARGFAQSKITSAENERNPAPNGEGRVKPAIVIVEGPRTRIGTITFRGNTAFSAEDLDLADVDRAGTGLLRAAHRPGSRRAAARSI